MRIRARMSMSADGYVTTPNGWPALTADPAWQDNPVLRRTVQAYLAAETTAGGAVPTRPPASRSLLSSPPRLPARPRNGVRR